MRGLAAVATVRVFVSVLAVVVAIVILSMAVAGGGALAGEVAVVRAWQRLPEPAPTIAAVVRDLTGTEANLVLLVPLGVAAWWRHRRRAVLALVILLVSMLVVQPVVKHMVDRDRPSTEQVDVRTQFDSRSYPSGHSLGTAAVWGSLAIYLGRTGRRRWAVAAAAPVAATWIASDVLGVHWPTDSLAGTAIGALAAAVAVVVVLGPRQRVAAPSRRRED